MFARDLIGSIPAIGRLPSVARTWPSLARGASLAGAGRPALILYSLLDAK